MGASFCVTASCRLSPRTSQSGWWDIIPERRLQWDQTQDEVRGLSCNRCLWHTGARVLFQAAALGVARQPQCFVWHHCSSEKAAPHMCARLCGAATQIGQHMLTAFRDANALRARFPALRKGWANILHEVRRKAALLAGRASSATRKQPVKEVAGLPVPLHIASEACAPRAAAAATLPGHSHPHHSEMPRPGDGSVVARDVFHGRTA
jgi:hypothetical protein